MKDESPPAAEFSCPEGPASDEITPAAGTAAAGPATAATTEGDPAGSICPPASLTASSQRRRPNTGRVLAVSVFLAVAVGLVFGQTWHHEFVNFDDGQYVLSNDHVKRGLTAEGIVWAFTRSHAANWHPLSWLSHMLDCQLYGVRPGGHHLTSVLLHAATSILLFLVLLSMTSRLWPSALVAALFAIHPLHVESVAWVAERKDVLSGLFFVLTLGAYVHYARRPFSAWRYLGVVLLFALGLMSKSMLVTLPGVLLLLDYWPLGRFRPTVEPLQTEMAQRSAGSSTAWRLLVEKIPLLMLAIGTGAVALLTQSSEIDLGRRFSMTERVANSIVSCVAYLGQLFYPVGLAAYYPHPADSLPFWKVSAALLLLVAITLGAVGLRRRCPYLIVGWLWYLGMLVPVIGLIQVGSQARADRYTYLTQIGLYIALVWGAARLVDSRPRLRLAAGAGGLLAVAALAGCAWRQTSYWHDGETLWNHTLSVTSRNPVAHNNLGTLIAARGGLDEAIDHFRQALEIQPQYLEARSNLATALAGQGKHDEVIAECEQALAIEPNCAPIHNAMANALGAQGKVNEAAAHFATALEINPDSALTHNNFANLLMSQGQLDDAIVHFRTALQIRPNLNEAHYNLANALLEQGKTDEAIAQYGTALEIDPKYVEAHTNLGVALFGQGKIDEATRHFERALEIRPTYAQAQFNLGLVLHGQGKSAEAVAHWREAVRLQPNHATFAYRLAWVLATSPDESIRNGPQAVELAERAVQLSGGRNPTIYDALAAAYAETGQYVKAVQVATRGRLLAEAQNNPALSAALRQRIEGYRAGIPYRE